MRLLDRDVAPSLDALWPLLVAAAEARRFHHHVSLNANKLHLARHDPTLRALLAGAATAAADGAAVLALARLWGLDVPERLPGVELATRLLEEGARRGWRTVLHGARPEVVGEVARRHRATVVGATDGYGADEAAVRANLARCRPHLVLVALGSPASERFLDRVRPDALCLGVGGTFDVLAGVVPRAPAATHALGLEGAWRVATSPRRRLGPALRMARSLAAIANEGPRAVGAA